MMYVRFVVFWQLMRELRMEIAVLVQAVHTMIASLNNRYTFCCPQRCISLLNNFVLLFL